jgi:hypothetical protein
VLVNLPLPGWETVKRSSWAAPVPRLVRYPDLFVDYLVRIYLIAKFLSFVTIRGTPSRWGWENRLGSVPPPSEPDRRENSHVLF